MQGNPTQFPIKGIPQIPPQNSLDWDLGDPPNSPLKFPPTKFAPSKSPRQILGSQNPFAVFPAIRWASRQGRVLPQYALSCLQLPKTCASRLLELRKLGGGSRVVRVSWFSQDVSSAFLRSSATDHDWTPQNAQEAHLRGSSALEK